jgi:NAD kinase
MTAIVCQLDLHLPMQPVPITTNICSHMLKSKSIVFKQDMQIKAKFVQMKMNYAL